MGSGPVEVLVIAFPENNFSGAIIPELAKVVGDGTITIIDGILAIRGADGTVELIEFDELDASSDIGSLGAVLDRVEGLISDEDVTALTESLEPNSSAAILVFEHTWVRPLRDAVVDAGGVLRDSIRIPGPVVDEVRAAIANVS